jgi:Flp pilus assembly protein TadG
MTPNLQVTHAMSDGGSNPTLSRVSSSRRYAGSLLRVPGCFLASYLMLGQKNARHSRGQSMVEFAFVLPLLLLAIISLFWSSQLLEAYDFVTYAAQAAARYAIVRGATSPQPATANDIASLVANMAAGLNPKQLTVTTNWAPNNQPGSTVQVQVQYAFQLKLPFMPSAAIPLSATSAMVISQ